MPHLNDEAQQPGAASCEIGRGLSAGGFEAPPDVLRQEAG